MTNATQKPKTSYFYKLFRVKRSDGRVTTVSICPVLATTATRRLPGGLREVGRFVREAALAFEDGMAKNCSGFVASRLSTAIEAAIKAHKAAKEQEAKDLVDA